jgi:2-(1,2-epoxy-1,2-dihydrophenyl)acetyl-CoA isomerase
MVVKARTRTGIADDVALIDMAFALGQKLGNGPASLRLTRKLFWESPNDNYEAQPALEREGQKRATATEDFREGVPA